MRLIGSDGHGVALGVVDYQFPDAPHQGQRQSWLIVQGSASCPQGTWSFRWQALTADDAVVLADWLRSAAGLASVDGPGNVSLGFTEPNLAFACARSDPHLIDLRISLDLEFSPPWHRRTHAGDPFVISCQITPEAMLEAAADWAAEIAPYPPWNLGAPS
jgi:hypothetical protein